MQTHQASSIPIAGDFGYGRFLLDAQSLEAVLAPSFDARHARCCRRSWSRRSWEAVRDAELAPARFLAFAVAQLPMTRDDIALAGLLARIEAAFRRYLNDAQRDAARARAGARAARGRRRGFAQACS